MTPQGHRDPRSCNEVNSRERASPLRNRCQLALTQIRLTARQGVLRFEDSWRKKRSLLVQKRRDDGGFLRHRCTFQVFWFSVSDQYRGAPCLTISVVSVLRN